MTKKLVASVIAGLFASSPLYAQDTSDPMRVEGTATLGGIYNNTNAFDRAQLDLYQDLSNGALSNVGVQGRHLTNWLQGYGENFGRTDQYMFLRGGMYDVFKAGAYLNDIPHTFSSNAWSPYAGNGPNTLIATFPLGALPSPQPPGNWSNFRLGYDRRDWGGFAEWQRNSPWYFRADGNQVSFSGSKVGSAAHAAGPGHRLRRPRVSHAIHDQQLGRGGRLPDGQGDVRAALGLQPVRQRQPHAPVDAPVLQPEPARHDLPAAEQHVQQIHGLGQLSRPAVAQRSVRPLHVGQDHQRRRARPHRARLGAGLQPDLAEYRHLQRRERQPVVRV